MLYELRERKRDGKLVDSKEEMQAPLLRLHAVTVVVALVAGRFLGLRWRSYLLPEDVDVTLSPTFLRSGTNGDETKDCRRGKDD